MLESVEYVSDDPTKCPIALAGPAPTNLAALWKAAEPLWAKLLRKHHIVAGRWSRAAFDSFRVRVERKNDAEEKNAVFAYELAAKQGDEPLVTRSFADQSGHRPLDAHLVAALRSPFDGRVVVVVVETHRGWEGPPHVEGVRLFGVHATL